MPNPIGLKIGVDGGANCATIDLTTESGRLNEGKGTIKLDAIATLCLMIQRI